MSRTYVLTLEAQSDLIGIWLDGDARWVEAVRYQDALHDYCQRLAEGVQRSRTVESQAAARRAAEMVAQWCFNKLKNARRVSARYDKTAESFRGIIDITSTRLWVRHLST